MVTRNPLKILAKPVVRLRYIILTALALSCTSASFVADARTMDDGTMLLSPARAASASGHPRSTPPGYGALAPIIDDADEILRKFDCGECEESFPDFRAGIQRLREYEILKLGYAHKQARINLYRERVKPHFVSAYKEHNNPAAAYYLALHAEDVHDRSCDAHSEIPLIPIVYYPVGSVLCGWFYPRFAPTYWMQEDALHALEFASSKCVDPELNAKIQRKVLNYQRSLRCLRWTFRTIALGTIAGGTTAAIMLTGHPAAASK